MKKIFYLLLLLVATNLLSAQSDIIVTVSINPPYSPYLSTYVDQPNKVLLTLTNTKSTPDSLKLWVKISGDNGVSVTTAAGFNPSEPIVLAGYETKMISFNSEETRDYFDAGHVDLVGITKSQLIQNQALPEGNYQICVRALGFAQPHVLKSMDACASFPLFYIDPPIAIQPTCGNDVTQTTPQFILFSWTPPATAQGLINYEFTLKEVPNTLNPNDVIKNNVFPILFNTTQTSNTILVYGIDKPQLEAGKKYVWRVKAVDPNNSVQFKNSGYSDVCVFNYNKAETVTFSNTISTPEISTPVIQNITPPVAQFFGNTYIMKGTLKYFFQSYKPDEKFALNKVPVSAIIRYKLITGGYTKWLTAMDLPQFTDADKVLYQSQTDANGNFTFPVTVDNDLGLIAKNQTVSSGYNIMTGIPSDFTGDLYRVLQVRVDDEHYCNPEDEITANDKIAQKLELFTRVRDYKLTYTVKTGLADFSGIYGQLQFSGLSMNAAATGTGGGNKPSSNTSGMNANINAGGTNFFNQGSPNINSYFYGQAQNIPSYFNVGNSDNQDGEYHVSIYRKSRPSGVPYNEGQTGSSQFIYWGMIPVATGTTSNGKIVFNRLVKNVGPNDEYFIKVEPVANANGAKLEQQFQFRYEPDPTVKPPFSEKDYAYFNNEYKTLNIDFSQTNNETVLATSALWGKMTYSYPGAGGESNLDFANQTIKLVVQFAVNTSNGMVNIYGSDQDVPGNQQTLATTKTDAEGKFVFNMYDEKDFGIVKSNADFYVGSGEFPDHYQGDLFRYIRVIVLSPHFNSPSDNFTIVPGLSKDLGTLNAVAKTYALSLNLVATPFVTNQLVPPTKPVNELDVYLIRKTRPADVYNTEAGNKQLNLTYGGYEVVDRKTCDANGNVRFDNLFKNIGDEDDYWIVAEPTAQGSKNYTSGGFRYIHVKYDGADASNLTFSGGNHDYAYFNNEYKYPVVSRNVIAYPEKPEITGRVVRADNSIKGIYHATVELMGLAIIIPVKESEEYTDGDGKFSFTGLSTQYDNNGQLNGYLRLLDISAQGFKKKTVNNLPFLKDGMRVNLGDIPLKPASIVKGQVIEDVYEIPTPSKVTIGAGATVETTPVSLDMSQGKIKFYGGNFETPSAMLPIQLMHVDPNSENYYDEWQWVVVDKPEVDLGKVKVFKKMHRIRVKITTAKEGGNVKIKTPGGGTQIFNPNSLVPASLKNFRVVIKNNTDTVLTDEAGIAEFKFESSSNQFQVKVYGPKDQDWEPKTVAVTNGESKDFSDVPIEMKAATKIYGQVTVGSSPVAAARVFLDESLEDPIETKTNASGFYVLHNVPRKSGAVFKAVKSSSNLVGDEKTISTYNVSDSVNFNLKVYDKIDITKMLNMPIEVEALKEDAGGVKITGAFSELANNDHFKFDNALRLKFNQISIKEGTKKNSKGVGYAVPVDDHVDIDGKNSIDLKVNNTFNGVQGEATDWLRVNKMPDDEGGLVGKVFIKDLATSSIKFDSDPVLGMGSGSFTSLKITSTASLPKNPSWLPDTYRLINKTGGNVTFKAYDLNAEATAATSLLKNDVLDFNTTIKATIPTLSNPNVSVNIGSLKVHQTSIEPVTGSAKISLTLENWKLTSTDWTFNSNGFNMQKGNLEMDGMNIPFKNIKVEKDKLSYATTNTFDLNSMTMLGLLPVTVNGPSQFGYNNSHWQLNVNPDASGYGAVMKNIPGMQGGSDLRLESIKLKSDGTKEYKVKSQTRTLYNLATYYVTNGVIGVYSDYINIPGMADINVPLVSPQPTSFVITKSGGTLSSKLDAFGFGFETSGIKLNFKKGKMTFANGTITAEGTASEDGVFSHDVKLFKTTDSVAINTIPGQTFNITKSGSQKFTNIFGRMVPIGGANWSKYYFDGDLVGSEGASGRMRNTVYGDIKLDNQQVQVKNVETPFGNMNMVYDFGAGKLVGTLDVNQSFGQGGSLTAHVESLFGSLGWYFCSGGTCVFPNNPYIKNMNVALVFGSYPVAGEPSITNTFKTYSYNGALPPSFASDLKGFFVDGKGTFPVPYVPDIDIDLIVLSAEVGADITGDYSIGMNFAGPGTVLYTGSAIKLHVWVSVGGSIGIACAGASGDLSVELKAAGELHSNGQFAIDGTFTVTLGACAYCGAGCCDSDCDDCCDWCVITHCFKDDWCGDKSVGATAHMDNSGASFNVNW